MEARTVSDDLSQAAESAEAAQGAVEPDAPSAPAPWGDDFNPERAWQTITHLRGREKELESDAKAWKRLQEDETAFNDLLTQRGYEVEAPAEYDVEAAEDPDDDPIRPLTQKLSELEQWKAQQEQQASLDMFHKDIAGFAADAKVELTDDDRFLLLQKTLQTGGNPTAAKKAFDAHVELIKAREKSIIDRYLKSKSDGVPSAPQPGKAGRAEFDPTDGKARKARMEAIIAAEQ